VTHTHRLTWIMVSLLIGFIPLPAWAQIGFGNVEQNKTENRSVIGMENVGIDKSAISKERQFTAFHLVKLDLGQCRPDAIRVWAAHILSWSDKRETFFANNLSLWRSLPIRQFVRYVQCNSIPNFQGGRLSTILDPHIKARKFTNLNRRLEHGLPYGQPRPLVYRQSFFRDLPLRTSSDELRQCRECDDSSKHSYPHIWLFMGIVAGVCGIVCMTLAVNAAVDVRWGNALGWIILGTFGAVLSIGFIVFGDWAGIFWHLHSLLAFWTEHVL